MDRIIAGNLPIWVALALHTAYRTAWAGDQIWTQTSAPTMPYHAVASSADGRTLVAVASGFSPGGPIFVSTNSAASWSLTSAPFMNWYSVASSADGTKLLATASGERPIFTSADSGATWTQATNELYANYYSCAASSADGTRLFVGLYDGVHHGGRSLISTDSGATWTDLTNGPPAVSIAMAADGTKLLVGAGPFGLGSFSSWFATSTNFGADWMDSTVPSSLLWNACATSADGTKLVAANADGTGSIYASKDSGAGWTTNNGPTGNWISLASSADGARLAAVQGGCFNPGGPGCGGPVHNSLDFGATWTSNNVPDAFAVASSADGNQLVAVTRDAGIWIRQTAPSPSLTLKPSGTNLVLSWVVPSLDFVLQENSDLAATNWTELLSTPRLNLTNLQYEVLLLPSATNRFYRLKH